MTERQKQFLRQLIESYVVSAEPVASGFIAEKNEVSSATVRNDMAALEQEGLIHQPHTSAGRIPSEEGYRFYLQNHLKPKSPTSSQKEKLDAALKNDDAVRSVAKELAEQSGVAVLVAFARNNFYYTGLSKLFVQPEFREMNAVIDISVVLDALDDTLEQLYESAGDEVQILIGKENPFSPQCSLLLTKNRTDQARDGVMAFLGPLRMDYNQNAGLLSYSKHILENALKKHIT